MLKKALDYINHVIYTYAEGGKPNYIRLYISIGSMKLIDRCIHFSMMAGLPPYDK